MFSGLKLCLKNCRSKTILTCSPANNLFFVKHHRNIHHLNISKYQITDSSIPLGMIGANLQVRCHNVCKYKQPFSRGLTVKDFHTSQPKNALPGIIYIIFKPILRFSAIIVAKVSKRWWSRLTPDQKRSIYSKIRKHQTNIIAITLASIGLTYIYYFLNLVTCPITGRQKFIIINNTQLKEISGLSFDSLIESHGKQVLPLGHPAYKQATRVVKKLLNANKDYTDKKELDFQITIIDDPSIINAFVLPDGRICIFTGMYQVCQTDDELATVLAHELSHTLLQHVAEKLSNKTFLEILYLVPLLFIWFLLPDLGAFVTHLLFDDVKDIIFELPFERDIEIEADEIGLLMMAKACYDVRVAPVFWHKMKFIETEQGGPKVSEFLSTHPSHENRANNLESKIKEAIDLRTKCNCPPLATTLIPRQQIIRILKPVPAG